MDIDFKLAEKGNDLEMTARFEITINVVPLALMTHMMDQRINSTVYVKVLKRTHEFLLNISSRMIRGKEKSLTLSGIKTMTSKLQI